MFYQALVHHKFQEPNIYNVSMEHNRGLVKDSPAYLENSELIDEYINLEEYFTIIFSMLAEITKLVKDESEQIVQIQCELDNAFIYLSDENFSRFQELRNLVGVDILKCLYTDFISVTDEKLPTLETFEEAYINIQRC